MRTSLCMLEVSDVTFLSDRYDCYAMHSQTDIQKQNTDFYFDCFSFVFHLSPLFPLPTYTQKPVSQLGILTCPEIREVNSGCVWQ